MKILGSFSPSLGTIVFDVDDTVYVQPEPYKEQIRQSNFLLLAQKLGISPEEAKPILKRRRQEVEQKLSREATITETLYSFGFSRDELQAARENLWHPEDFINADLELAGQLARLQQQYQIVFGTNSPLNVGRRILEKLGISQALGDPKIFGPESFLEQKPSPSFYVTIAETICVEPFTCLSVGDREMSEGTPAIMAGYSAALILDGNRNELVRILDKIIGRGFGVLI